MEIIEKRDDGLTVRMTDEEARGLISAVEEWECSDDGPWDKNLPPVMLTALALQDAIGESSKLGTFYWRAVYEKAAADGTSGSDAMADMEPTP